jgi:hypothetical protein
METGSYQTAHTTTQSSRTVETVVHRKEVVSAGDFRQSHADLPSLGTLAVAQVDFLAFGLCIRKFRSRRQGFERQMACGSPGN